MLRLRFERRAIAARLAELRARYLAHVEATRSQNLN